MLVPSDARLTLGAQPSRRDLARLIALGAAAVTVGGCGVRLESAPAVTAPTATRRPAPEEDLLQAALARAQRLADLAARSGRAEVADRHSRQVQVCRSILAAAGAPGLATTPMSDAATSSLSTSLSTSGASSTPEPAPSLTALAVAEGSREGLPWSMLAGAVTHLRLLVSLAAHDAAVAASLGSPVAWPTGWQPPPAVARAQLEPARAAAYAFEVAAARVPLPQRAPLLQTLGALTLRVQRLGQVAGSMTGAPLAYTLPFPVQSRTDADRLARGVLEALVARGLDGLDPLEPVPAGQVPPQPAVDAVVGTVALLTEALTLGVPWGAAVAPFPGLVIP